MSRGIRQVALLALAAAFAFACGGSAQRSGGGGEATGAPYVVGMEGALTSPYSIYPTNALAGMRAYFYDLNHKGGIQGHPVNLAVADDNGQPAKASTNFLSLRDSSKVSVLAGNTLSNVVDALAAASEQAQIPMLVTAPTPAEMTKPYIYGTDALFDQQAQALVDAVKAQLKPGDKPRIVGYYSATAAGHVFGDGLAKAVQANGWTLAYNDELSVPAPSDFTPFAQKIVGAKADYVIGTIYGPEPPLLMKALRQLGFNGKVYSFAAGGDDPTQLVGLNDPSYYVLRTYKYPTDSAAGPKALLAAAAKNGDDKLVDEYASQGWVIGAILAAAFKACGFPCPGPALKQALDKVQSIGTVDGTAEGDIGFKGGSHLAVHGATVVHAVNGKLVASAPVTLKQPGA
jgi:ABC-type branched-subunit amino acid transport system substrate-binding protein